MKEAFVRGETKAFTLRMDSDLHYRLKLRALEEGRTMTDILDELARGYLDGKKS
ncbi:MULTISPECIES: toxin-antitoxin system HicB family antitoxin [Corynebacterium]|nr:MULTISPECIES: toxin-antitoxin system HicB family antitoxin [Corynebacterium]